MSLELSEGQQRKLTDYINLLQKWNRTYNLTAIREPQRMVSHHILDSLVLAQFLEDEQRNIVDVGSGAGLPGIPLSILFPRKNFTLLDSNGKKTRFMMQAGIELDLQNCQVKNCRVESFHSERPFDVAVSRAFSSIEDFVNGAVHLLGPSGRFYAMKGKDPQPELCNLPGNIKLESLQELQVPFLQEQRHLVILSRTC